MQDHKLINDSSWIVSSRDIHKTVTSSLVAECLNIASDQSKVFTWFHPYRVSWSYWYIIWYTKIKNFKTAQYIMIPYRLTNRGEQLHKRRITGSATAQSTPEWNHIVLLSEQDNRRTNDNKYLTWLCVIQFKRIHLENCTSIHPSIYPWWEREGGGGALWRTTHLKNIFGRDLIVSPP